MLRELRGKGIVVIFLIAVFLFLITLKESLGQIEVLPGSPASPIEKENTKDNKIEKQQDLITQELRRIDLVLSNPKMLFLLPTLESGGYAFEYLE